MTSENSKSSPDSSGGFDAVEVFIEEGFRALTAGDELDLDVETFLARAAADHHCQDATRGASGREPTPDPTDEPDLGFLDVAADIVGAAFDLPSTPTDAVLELNTASEQEGKFATALLAVHATYRCAAAVVVAVAGVLAAAASIATTLTATTVLLVSAGAIVGALGTITGHQIFVRRSRTDVCGRRRGDVARTAASVLGSNESHNPMAARRGAARLTGTSSPDGFVQSHAAVDIGNNERTLPSPPASSSICEAVHTERIYEELMVELSLAPPETVESPPGSDDEYAALARWIPLHVPNYFPEPLLEDEVEHFLRSASATSMWLDLVADENKKALARRWGAVARAMTPTRPWRSPRPAGASNSNVHDLIRGRLENLVRDVLKSADHAPHLLLMVDPAVYDPPSIRLTVARDSLCRSSHVENILLWAEGEQWAVARQTVDGCTSVITHRTDSRVDSVALAKIVQTFSDVSDSSRRPVSAWRRCQTDLEPSPRRLELPVGDVVEVC